MVDRYRNSWIRVWPHAKRRARWSDRPDKKRLLSVRAGKDRYESAARRETFFRSWHEASHARGPSVYGPSLLGARRITKSDSPRGRLAGISSYRSARITYSLSPFYSVILSGRLLFYIRAQVAPIKKSRALMKLKFCGEVWLLCERGRVGLGGEECLGGIRLMHDTRCQTNRRSIRLLSMWCAIMMDSLVDSYKSPNLYISKLSCC